MAIEILETLALAGCVFLVYVLVQFRREGRHARPRFPGGPSDRPIQYHVARLEIAGRAMSSSKRPTTGRKAESHSGARAEMEKSR